LGVLKDTLTSSLRSTDAPEPAPKKAKASKKRDKKKKKKIYYAPPSQWKVTDFFPEDSADWHNPSVSSPNTNPGALSFASFSNPFTRPRLSSAMSSQSLNSSVSSTSGGSPTPYSSVVDQLGSFNALGEPLHEAISQISAPSTDDDVFRMYSRRDRSAAALLTAGIKANIIDEIREAAVERAEKGDEPDVFETMEGRIAKAAFMEMKADMTRVHGGIKVIKHARNGTHRVVKLKLKGVPPHFGDDDTSGSEEEGDPHVMGKRRSARSISENPDVETGGHNTESSTTAPKDDHFDEFAEENWDHKNLKSKKKGTGKDSTTTPSPTPALPTAGPFLHYRGGFWNKAKKRIDLKALTGVKKGIQTDVLKNDESVSSYKNYAYLSLEFDADEKTGNDEPRTFDIEIINGDVSLRDKLLHGFKYVALRNAEVARSANRLHSWDLEDQDANERMRKAWDGRTSSIDDALRGQVQSWVERRLLAKAESQREGSESVETLPDEVLDKVFFDLKSGEMQDRSSRSSSRSSYSSIGEDYEVGGEESEEKKESYPVMFFDQRPPENNAPLYRAASLPVVLPSSSPSSSSAFDAPMRKTLPGGDVEAGMEVKTAFVDQEAGVGLEIDAVSN
jgi:hypothetical protein